eukprot:4127968-Pleurochrysis_carterae.AAC.1
MGAEARAAQGDADADERETEARRESRNSKLGTSARAHRKGRGRSTVPRRKVHAMYVLSTRWERVVRRFADCTCCPQCESLACARSG